MKLNSIKRKLLLCIGILCLLVILIFVVLQRKKDLMYQVANAWEQNISLDSGSVSVTTVETRDQDIIGQSKRNQSNSFSDFNCNKSGFIEWVKYSEYGLYGNPSNILMEENHDDGIKYYAYDKSQKSYQLISEYEPIVIDSMTKYFMTLGCQTFISEDMDLNYVKSICKKQESMYNVYTVVFNKDFYETSVANKIENSPHTTTSYLKSTFWVNKKTGYIDVINTFQESSLEYGGQISYITLIQTINFSYTRI